jgi:hypothetical protein
MISKIRTKQEIEKQQKRNQLIVGIVLAALMVLSSIGYAVMSNDSGDTATKTVKYGNLVFQQANGYWNVQLSNKILFFNSLPTEVANISSAENISITDYYGKNVYVVNSNSAVNGVAAALEGIVNRLQEACLEGTDCANSEFPVKTCEDYLIVYNPSVINSSVDKIGNCVYLNGDPFKASDKFIYRLFNIA